MEADLTTRALAAVERLGLAQLLLLSTLLVLVVGAVDFWTGEELSLTVLYLVPVGLAAWSASVRLRWGIVLMSAAVWWMADQAAGRAYSQWWIGYWNAGVRLVTFVTVASALSTIHDLLQRERQLARTDGLTGLVNARAFRAAVEVELERAQRTRRAFSLLYLDVDRFKAVNDLQGHAAGDRLLRAVAGALRERLRRIDTVARLGGDEFAVLLPEVGPDAVEPLVGELRLAVERAVRAGGWPVSVSIGATTVADPAASAAAVLEHADGLMYAAKQERHGSFRHAVLATAAAPPTEFAS